MSSCSRFGNVMSKIGKNPIVLPQKTEAAYADGVLTIKGPKGGISRRFTDDVTVSIQEREIVVAPVRDTQFARQMWGTTAAHIRNMVEGVTEGFTKVLQIEGVGYRAEVKGANLVMQLGFSHPITLPIPQGILIAIEKGVMTMTGFDKDLLGQFAASVRAYRKPEPYKGKGIRYQGEYIIRKQGKKAT